MNKNNKAKARDDKICRSCYWWNFKDKKCEKPFDCERRK